VIQGGLRGGCISRRTGEKAVEALELADSKRALDVAEPVIHPQFDHVIDPGTVRFACPVIGRNAVIAEDAHVLCKRGIVGRDRPALAGRRMPYGVEAERRKIRERTNSPAAKRMAGVGNDRRAGGVRYRP
jgi:hypothetical protein